jgi:hypothetical protein
MIVDQLALGPFRYDLFELKLEILPSVRVRELASQRSVQMVRGAEVVSVFKRNDCKLIMGLSRVRVYFCGQVVVPLRRTPIAVLLHQFSFAVTREIAELNERLMARKEDLGL